MSEIDSLKLLEILGEFGFKHKAYDETAIRLPDLERDHQDAKNHLVYLLEKDFIEISGSRASNQDGETIVELNREYEDLAKYLDHKLNSRDTELEDLLKDLSKSYEELVSPETKSPEEVEEIQLDHEAEAMPVRYDVVLYPFGRASLKGSSRRKLKKPHIKKATGLEEIENSLRLLETVNYLERVSLDGKDNDYYRLVDDPEVIQYVENLATCIENEYDNQLWAFRDSPETWHNL